MNLLSNSFILKKVALIVNLLIIFQLFSCREKTMEVEGGDEICNCLASIKLDALEPYDISVSFSQCIKPFFEDFIEEKGYNKELFLAERREFLLSMNDNCSSFKKVAKYWIEYDNNYFNKSELDLTSELDDVQCGEIMVHSWEYKNSMEGIVIFKFINDELYKVSKEYGDSTIFKINRKSACNLELILKSSTSPFSLMIPDNHEEGIYFISEEEGVLNAYYEVEKDLFKGIKLVRGNKTESE